MSNGVPPPVPAVRRWRLSNVFFVVGLIVLAFTLGAAVMFFQWPPSDLLAKSFIGGRAWMEPATDNSEPLLNDFTAYAGGVDRPGETFDGYTLCSFAAMNGSNTEAHLIDMKHKIRQTWRIKFSQIWPNPKHVQAPVNDALVTFFGLHLYPNGDLLVILHGIQQQAIGYGLVKLDKNSNVLWTYDKNIHHDLDVGPDGTLYALQQEMAQSMPVGLRHIPTPCLVDSVILLTPDGKPKGTPIPILEAFRDSPYAALLDSLEPGAKRQENVIPLTGPSFDERILRADVLHTNFVKVLTPELAAKFPGWKAGQLLLSLRNVDTIALLDPDTRRIVWAARGPWKAQHDVQYLENGNLLIFDNRGLPKGSRVLEYNPRTQAMPWSYTGENWGPFYSNERGLSQRLPNGNTLAVNSAGGEILEVSPRKEVVWSFLPHRFLTYGRRYSPAQVPFLGNDVRPR